MATSAKGAFDIIGRLADGSITPDKAREYFELVLDSSHGARAPELLGFEGKEWNALLLGAPFDQLAQWRKDGWPTKCSVCGQDLHIAAAYWLIDEIASGGHTIIHTKCVVFRAR